MTNNESQEMYLETILKLQKRKGTVHAIDVAEELGYSKPSVSRADGTIDFTDSGREKAARILDRHKSLTDALVKMGMERGAAEENACRVEHVLTEDAYETIKNYFKV